MVWDFHIAIEVPELPQIRSSGIAERLHAIDRSTHNHGPCITVHAAGRRWKDGCGGPRPGPVAGAGRVPGAGSTLGWLAWAGQGGNHPGNGSRRRPSVTVRRAEFGARERASWFLERMHLDSLNELIMSYGTTSIHRLTFAENSK